MKSVRLAMFLFVTAGFVPLGVLGWFAWVQLAKEEAQVLDESRRTGETALAAVQQRYDARLREMIKRETQRDFTEFQHWHAPLNIQAQAPSVVRSPLAAEPEDGFIRYYFQVSSDGKTVNYSSPHESQVVDLPLEDYQAPVEQSRLFLTTNGRVQGEVMAELPAMLATAPHKVLPDEVPQKQWLATPGAPADTPQSRAPGPEEKSEPQRLVETRSGDKPASEQTLLNEVLLVNFNSTEVAVNAQRQQQDRVGKKSYSNDDAWTNLNRGNVLDPTQRSVVKVYPYYLHVGAGNRPLTLMWRTVVTPTHTLMQGCVLNFDHLASTWLPAQVRQSPELRLSGADIKPAPVVLNPGAADFDEQLAAGFGRLPLEVVSNAGPVRARFETTRSHYAMIAGGYLLVLALLGVLLVRTIARHSALVRQQQDFLAAVSHELRTPLSSMRLYTEMALQNTQGNETLNRHVDRILKEEDRLTRIIEMLLMSAKIERGALTLELSDVPLHEPLRAAVELARTYHPGREISMPENTLPAARLDRAAAGQLFYNLIDNALKYSRENNRPVDIAVQSTPEQVSVLVRDYGCGISKGDLAKLFQRFYRGAGASSYGAGTGLGLWLCKTYADAMGWELEVSSHPGEGTCVSVQVPLSPNS